LTLTNQEFAADNPQAGVLISQDDDTLDSFLLSRLNQEFQVNLVLFVYR